ncbi:low temperature requirement protein A [Ilumatobacter sp.]|uniref:low temperature requirement protein A n=1 Tax=Ilumatobacter sp. TaxID=1967498 RepID=UPI003B5179B7
MRGVEVPPPDDDFTADPVELFFDLAFVFAFSRLVSVVVHEPTWAGVGEVALLLTLIWLPWSQFTWSANAVAGNARPIRALFLVGTVASVPMAASVTTALDGGGPTFAIPLAGILSLALATMIAGLPDEHEARSAILRYSIPNAIAIVVLVAGSFLPREARIVAWIAAAVIVIIGTVRAGGEEWLVRPGHFAERHGLIIIVALGEVIVAVGAPLVERFEAGEGLPATTLVSMTASGAFACLIWWGYFDRVNRSLEHRHDEHSDHVERGRFARDVYTYAHLPIVGGVIFMAAALEEVALHPDEALPVEFRWLFVGGMALGVGGIVAGVWRAFGIVAHERIVGVAVLAVVVVVAGSIDGVWLVVVIDVVLLVALVIEHVRIEGVPRSIARDPSRSGEPAAV